MVAWLLAFHIISVVCWFAGLFYLPRLFVYHIETHDNLSLERFVVMERRLFNFIMTPAAILTVFFGLWLLLAHWDFYRLQLWMHVKLALVVLLLVYHAYCGYIVRLFAQGKKPHSAVFFRFFNEVPTIFLIVIVILVVVKPF